MVMAVGFEEAGRDIDLKLLSQLLHGEDGRVLGTADAGQNWATLGRLPDASGFAFDGPDLLVSGRSRQGTGLHRVTDTNGDGLGDRVELLELSTGEALRALLDGSPVAESEYSLNCQAVWKKS